MYTNGKMNETVYSIKDIGGEIHQHHHNSTYNSMVMRNMNAGFFDDLVISIELQVKIVRTKIQHSHRHTHAATDTHTFTRIYIP